MKAYSSRNLSVHRNERGEGFLASVVGLIFGIILGIVAMRFLFRLLGANETHGFVQWIYSASTPLVSPFFGIFGQDINIATGRFEFATLVALIVYGVVASLVMGLTTFGFHRHHPV